MCEFISWKEVKTKSGEVEILFLTANDVFNTKRGNELQKHTTRDDWVGHGAIAFFYEIDADKGINRECADFSSPSNFPKVIADAIRADKMGGLCWDVFPKGLLRAPLYAQYLKARAALDAQYQKDCAALDAQYLEDCAALDAKYQKARAALDAQYQKDCAALDAQYLPDCAPLDAKYQKARAALDAQYQKARAPLDAKYLPSRAPLYAQYLPDCDALDTQYLEDCAALDAKAWQKFKIKRNREKAWQ